MLRHIRIKSYKSIRDQTVTFGRLNILIGANGAGKSNLISFFRMLGSLISGNLQLFVGRSGGAGTFLHYGGKIADCMESRMTFGTDTETKVCHEMRLARGAQDTFVFANEQISFSDRESETEIFGPGHRESGLAGVRTGKTPGTVHEMIRQCRCFQFHDTSETARMRQNAYAGDSRYLKEDAGNLAAFLRMLGDSKPGYYQRILALIRQAAPHFDDFDLTPAYDPKYVMLNWKERGSDYLFGPHQLPDGLLRFIALTALLFQPEDGLPGVILIDEPELGLHPFAINLLGSLIRKASYHSQIIIATQSLNLVDQFEPADVLVAERRNSASEFTRPDPEVLRDWLEEYSLSQLWEKNVIGGRP